MRLSEKRKFPRLPIALKAVLPTFFKEQEIIAKIINISRKGLGVEFSGPDVDPGARVDMSLYLEDQSEPVSCCGKIAWVQSGQDRKSLGIEIESMACQGRAEVLSKAYKIWRQSEEKMLDFSRKNYE